jgi:hypothetical protein
VFPLAYVQMQARAFRAEADALGLLRPRIAHFDIGGFALESDGEVIDLAGLTDSYIGRVGYKDEQRVRDYLFDEVQPEMINIHGPCAYLRTDPRLDRYTLRSAPGLWGENWVRRDEACPAGVPTLASLEALPARAVREVWLCARARVPPEHLPDVGELARRLAADGLRSGDHDDLAAAVALDPTQTRAAQRLVQIQLERAGRPRE